MLAEIIPEHIFASLPSWALFLASGAAVALLVFGSGRAVTEAVKLAKTMGLSTIIIGATVVSLGTTSPEAFVSVTAAFRGQSGFALGNGVGSIICDTALIFGLGCCLVRLPKDRFILARHGWLQIGSGVLLACVIGGLALARGSMVGVVIGRGVGVALLLLLAGYMWLSVRWAKQHPEAISALASQVAPISDGGRKIALTLLGLALGLAMVIFGSQIMVGSVAQLCLRWGVPQSVLAVTLIAMGTSLPELVTAIAAIVKGHPELLIGNIIGADILNVLFVIGASATAVPLAVPMEFFYLHLPVMLLALVLMRGFMLLPGKQFSRWQGIPLLAVFAGYYMVLLILVANGTLRV